MQKETQTKNLKEEENEGISHHKEEVSDNHYQHYENLKIEKSNFIIFWFQQLFALCYKNWILSRRSWKMTLVRIVGPSCLLLLFWGIMYALKQNDLSLPITPLDEFIPRCKYSRCRTLFYSPDNEINYQIMKQLADNNQPPLKITPFNTPPSDDDDISPTTLDPNTFVLLLYNKTFPGGWTAQGAIFFDIYVGSAYPYAISHEIVYNATPTCPFLTNCQNLDDYYIQMQAQLQKAIVWNMTGLYPDIKFSLKPFPVVSNVSSVPTLQNFTVVFMYCLCTFSFIAMINKITFEREKGLRGLMKVLGLKDSVFWTSWFIDHFTIYLVSIFVVSVLGYSLPYLDFFQKTSPFVLVAIFVTYGVSLTIWAFAWASLLRSSKAANIVGFIFFALGLGFALFFGSTPLPLGYYIFTDSVKDSIGAPIPNYFFLFPPFHFCKLIMDIQGYVNIKDPFLSGLVPPSVVNPISFTWSDLYLDPGARWQIFNFKIPTPSTSLFYLLANIPINLILIWYFDKVIPDNYQRTESPFFFLFPSYWGISSSSEPSNIHETSGLLSNQEQDMDVQEEEASCKNSDSALQVLGLSKIYGFRPFHTVSALNNFYLSAVNGTIVAILGHNGAGKTTLINILTGVTAPSSGDAKIYGLSVVRNIDKIREFIGICPQFDLLWPDLTAKEHLNFLSKLKFAGSELSEKDINNRLQDVRLLKVANNRTQTFSGGMKRRLAVAISTIGSPKIIFMDEPTSAMDPRNRRHIWTLIQKISKNRLIILTTHSMEEAEILGEKIGIMAGGKLKAVGNSLHLKSRFGSGYRLSLVAEEANIPTVKQFVSSMVPQASLQEENAGSLIYSLASIESQQVTSFFDYLQKTLNENKLVRDWGLHNSTLEDVFLRVTREGGFGTVK